MLTHVITHPVKTGRPHIEIAHHRKSMASSSCNIAAKSPCQSSIGHGILTIYAQKSSGVPGNCNKEPWVFVIWILSAADENFVVSARKYRPTFLTRWLAGTHYDNAEECLDNNNSPRHCSFAAPDVGKLLRTHRCPADYGFEKAESNSLNIFELDAASITPLRIFETWLTRFAIHRKLGSLKSYIIDEVPHALQQAFNAFLKTAGEPPYIRDFHPATQKSISIPTILSRCQIFDLTESRSSISPITLKKIAKREEIPEKRALHLIAQKADGALRDALSIFDLMVTSHPEKA